MAEENLSRDPSRESRETKTTLEKIEGLIVDGQKEVLDKIVKLEEGQNRLEEGQNRLEEGQKSIIEWVKKIDKKHDINAEAQYDLMQDVKKDVGEIKEKLEAHLRVPHAV